MKFRMSEPPEKGKAIVNLVNLVQRRKDRRHHRGQRFRHGQYVVMATRNGIVKKTALTEFANPRSSGIIAIHVPDDDELIGCQLTDGSYDVLLATRKGKAIRFSEKEVRDMGRTARGVIGIRMAGERPGRCDVSLQGTGAIPDRHGKRIRQADRCGGIPLPGARRFRRDQYQGRRQERRGRQHLPRSGRSSVMLITAQGKLIQLNTEDIRNTQTRAAVGVKCIDLEEGDYVASVTVVAAEETSSGGQ